MGEIDWCSRLADGDETALGEIYDQFGGLVYGIALRVTRDEWAAEDVTQETFAYVWQKPRAFDPDCAPLRSWLCMLAHRRSVDWVRRAESQRKRADMVSQEPAIDLVDPIDLVAAEITNRDQVIQALTLLNDEQRNAIHLAFFDGMTYRQVATTLDIPEGTAKSRIRLGLQHLANHLNTAAAVVES